MPLLANLVRTSQRVATTASRRAKVQELALFLKALPADEIETAVDYLSGELPQGKIGIAYKALHAAAESAQAANEEQLSIAEVDQSLTAIAALRGAGSTAAR